jgi:glucans biosynthesis protein
MEIRTFPHLSPPVVWKVWEEHEPKANAWPGGGREFSRINPMNQDLTTRLNNMGGAPRCGAKTRTGTPCQCPAISGRTRCRIHGGLSPGAPRGERNGNFKNGFWTCEAVQERQWAIEMVKLYTKAIGE